MALQDQRTVNLDRLGLLSGQAKQLELEVGIGSIDLGGHQYGVIPDPVSVRLDASRTVAGYALRLRFEAEVDGPCMRCLEPAAVHFPVDVREVDQPSALDEEDEDTDGELSSPYVDGGELDISGWARDALVLDLPDPILCREECAGLCPVCGEQLAGSEPGAHDHDAGGDPRWAALRQLDLNDD